MNKDYVVVVHDNGQKESVSIVLNEDWECCCRINVTEVWENVTLKKAREIAFYYVDEWTENFIIPCHAV